MVCNCGALAEPALAQLLRMLLLLLCAFVAFAFILWRVCIHFRTFEQNVVVWGFFVLLFVAAAATALTAAAAVAAVAAAPARVVKVVVQLDTR